MTPQAALSEIWTRGGGDRSALGRVALTGDEPALPSSFAVGTLAQATIAASALGAAEIWRARTGGGQTVSVDMRHAAAEFRSERYIHVEGQKSHAWDAIAGVYQTGDGRYVRVHTNFPHHRAGLLKLLGAEYDRASVARALDRWEGEPFETKATEANLVVALMRSREEWSKHPQGQALATLPVFEIVRIGDAAPRPWPAHAGRPLSGLRVLDLTRVIAGPVCGRTLAAHGADVLNVTSPNLPSVLISDTGRGKLAASVELNSLSGRETLARLLSGADVFVQGYRPGAIGAKGFSPERCAELSPGIVYVSLSAYGHMGPWGSKRGFDSLVQTATGFNHAEGRSAGVETPKELPCQALDHASGYLMATGAMLALLRQRSEGGSWLVRVSLAQTGSWLWTMGRLENGFRAPDPKSSDVADFLERSESGFGAMTAVRHSGLLSETPPRWERPAVPLGTHPARWPDAS